MRRLTVTLAVLALTLGGCEAWQADATVGPPGSFVEAGQASSLAGGGYGGDTATLLPDGRVLSVGGGSLVSATVWEPSDGMASSGESPSPTTDLHR